MSYEWELVATATQPDSGIYAALAYDSDRDVIVLWGGTENNGFVDYADVTSTWEYDGTDWSLISTTNNPGDNSTDNYRVDQHFMEYDTVRQECVLNRLSASSNLRETWRYDGSDWTKLSPATELSSFGSNISSVWDSTSGRVVAINLQKTWSWDGTTWADLSPATLQSQRASAGSSYDSARDRIVLFGGTSGGTPRSDTWEYDGSGWTSLSPVANPTPASDELKTSMVYDPILDVTVLANPVGAGSLQQLWLWDGTNWTQQTVTTGPYGIRPNLFFHDGIGRTMAWAIDPNDTDYYKLWKLTSSDYPSTFVPQIIRRR